MAKVNIIKFPISKESAPEDFSILVPLFANSNKKVITVFIFVFVFLLYSIYVIRNIIKTSKGI